MFGNWLIIRIGWVHIVKEILVGAATHCCQLQSLPENGLFVPSSQYRSCFGPVLKLTRRHFSTGSKFESSQNHFSIGRSHRPVLNVAFQYRSVFWPGTKMARPFSTGPRHRPILKFNIQYRPVSWPGTKQPSKGYFKRNASPTQWGDKKGSHEAGGHEFKSQNHACAYYT